MRCALIKWFMKTSYKLNSHTVLLWFQVNKQISHNVWALSTNIIIIKTTTFLFFFFPLQPLDTSLPVSWWSCCQTQQAQSSVYEVQWVGSVGVCEQRSWGSTGEKETDCCHHKQTPLSPSCRQFLVQLQAEPGSTGHRIYDTSTDMHSQEL